MILTFILWVTLTFAGSTQNLIQENTNNKVDSTEFLTLKIKQLQVEINQLSYEVQSLKNNRIHEEAEFREYVQDKYGTILQAYALAGGFLGLIFVGSIISFLVHQFTKNQVNKFFESDEWTSALRTKIRKQIAENRFKETLKIHVLSKNEETENIIRNYFTENNFSDKNITYKQKTDLDLKTEHVELLFINNKDDAFQMDSKPFDELIKKIKKENKNIAVFYFNDSNVRFPPSLDQGLNSSFSNSLASMYHNLLDLMRYKYLVIDNKEL